MEVIDTNITLHKHLHESGIHTMNNINVYLPFPLYIKYVFQLCFSHII